ncbi:MAG: SDR family oxidoreductase [Desulfobulbaceae bacterium]|jgi:short-subunit dehydrogenase|nr:SDR family oxidoreductase [Desulfobulbaceae bacterium]
MATMLILGAASDIARATALAFACEGWDLIVAGRKEEILQKIAADISLRSGRTVKTAHFDALKPEEHAVFWRDIEEETSALFCAIGFLGEQERAQHDFGHAETILRTNFTGLTPILSLAANTFERRGRGLIIAVSSVAGDRGRASNYLYGSAKAGLTAFLSGLRNRLATKGVTVITVKPGFVATAMTAGMNLPTRLTATPQQVAADIVKAVKKKRNVVYSRWFWRSIMMIIGHIPECMFKRLKL